MWEDEAEFRDFIKRKLQTLNHTVRSEVTISRFRVDFAEETIAQVRPIVFSTDKIGCP